jgi:hypothetical protein
MKHFLRLALSIVVILSLVLMINKYAEGVIGDSGKPSPALKQSLLQDVMKIKEEINTLQSKLNKANEGENLTKLLGTQSVNNLKNLFNSLSSKVGMIGDSGEPSPTEAIGDTGEPGPTEAIGDIGKPRPEMKTSTGSIQKLSDGVANGMIIINDLEQKVGRNMKSDSLQQLRNLSDVVNKLEAVLQGDQPEYRK